MENGAIKRTGERALGAGDDLVGERVGGRSRQGKGLGGRGGGRVVLWPVAVCGESQSEDRERCACEERAWGTARPSTPLPHNTPCASP
mgnify:CR=1 FL=1